MHRIDRITTTAMALEAVVVVAPQAEKIGAGHLSISPMRISLFSPMRELLLYFTIG